MGLLGYDISNYSWWKPRADRVVYVASIAPSTSAILFETLEMLFKNKYLVKEVVAACALVMLAGCKQVPMLPGTSAHVIDIQQGNAVTQEMVAKLQPGMTRNQVRFVLGTPLLVDPFRADRWDYFYSYSKGGKLIEQRRFIVFFKDDKLDRIEGDVIAAKPVADKPATDAPKPAAAPLKPEAEKPATKPAASPAALKDEPAKPAGAPAPAGTTLSTGDGAPAGSGVSAAAEKPAVISPAAKPEAKVESKPAEKPKEERGFFSRMLDKIGL